MSVRRISSEFFRFAAVGLAATGLQYCILIAAVEFLHSDAVVASAMGFVISAVFNYLLNYRFTFRSAQKHSIAALRFGIVAAAGLLLNTALMAVLVEGAQVPYIAAQLVTTGAVLAWNFCGNAFWTFATSRHKNGDSSREEKVS
jgi:putative flippase GtrA